MIQPIVEGHGDVEAVPVLVRRLIEEAGTYKVQVGAPIRRRRHDLVREEPLKRSAQLARRQRGCSSILIVLDADNDCPAELAPTLEHWTSYAAPDVPCRVVMPCREYEAWFLAGIVGLRGCRGIVPEAEFEGEPEGPRGAKAALERLVEPGGSYLPTVDQAALSARIDLASAHRRSRSFRKLIKAFGDLATAVEALSLPWPPVGW